jgi:Na+-translocating ferredoxin:NAD+ oxidoreductase subunit C
MTGGSWGWNSCRRSVPCRHGSCEGKISPRRTAKNKEAATSPGTRTFAGGYFFRDFIGQPLSELVDLGVPHQVILSLTDPQGVSLLPAVQKGAQVKAGQVIARAPGRIAAILLSSVSGSVEDVRMADGGPGAITIRADGSPGWTQIEMAGPEAASGPPETIERIISQSGISAIPTRFATAAIGATDVENVIINGVNADVYNPSLPLIAGARLADLASAVRILRRIYPTAGFSVAFDTRSRSLLQELCSAAPQGGITFHLLKPKFPQQREEMLLPVVLGRPFPYGYGAINCGVLVLDIQTVLAVHDAVVLGKPAIERIIALSGPAFTRNIHVRARIGTVVSDIVDSRLRSQGRFRLVENSLLTGRKIANPASTPVGQKTDNLIAVPEKEVEGFLPFAGPGFRKDSHSLAFASRFLPLGKEADTNLHGEERVCISCGFCENVCPVRILPSLLHRYVKRGIIDETVLRYRITRCIDCNLCTYVCTSKIDLASLIRQGKARLAAAGYGEISSEVPPERLKGIAAKEPAL